MYFRGGGGIPPLHTSFSISLYSAVKVNNKQSLMHFDNSHLLFTATPSSIHIHSLWSEAYDRPSTYLPWCKCLHGILNLNFFHIISSVCCFAAFLFCTFWRETCLGCNLAFAVWCLAFWRLATTPQLAGLGWNSRYWQTVWHNCLYLKTTIKSKYIFDDISNITLKKSWLNLRTIDFSVKFNLKWIKLNLVAFFFSTFMKWCH